jgi:hypothetical protein
MSLIDASSMGSCFFISGSSVIFTGTPAIEQGGAYLELAVQLPQSGLNVLHRSCVIL